MGRRDEYENWTRASYRSAYEEVDGLYKKLIQEHNELKAQLEKENSWKEVAQKWANHSIILGNVLKTTLKD